MSREPCPSCGRPLIFGFTLCSACDNRRKQETELQQRSTRALEEQTRILLRHEFEREEIASKQRKKERREEIHQAVQYASSLPDMVLDWMANAPKTLDGKLQLLTNIAAEIDIAPSTWKQMRKYSALQIDLAYSRLRKILVPFVVGCWHQRQQLGEIGTRAIRSIANAIRFTDLEAYDVLEELLPKERERLEERIRHLPDALNDTKAALADFQAKASAKARAVNRINMQIRVGKAPFLVGIGVSLTITLLMCLACGFGAIGSLGEQRVGERPPPSIGDMVLTFAFCWAFFPGAVLAGSLLLTYTHNPAALMAKRQKVLQDQQECATHAARIAQQLKQEQARLDQQLSQLTAEREQLPPRMLGDRIDSALKTIIAVP